MSKVSKNITYCFIFILILLSISTIYKLETGYIEINSIFRKIDDLDIKKDNERINHAINLVENKSSNKKVLLKAKVLDAYLKYKDERYEESINILNGNIFNVQYEKLYRGILSETYKLKYLNYVHLNKGKKAEENFEKLIDLKNYSDKYIAELIDLFSDTLGELLAIDSGTEVASSLVDKLTIISSKISNYSKSIDLYKNAGTIYMVKNQLDISLENQIKALEIASKKSDEEQAILILIDISCNYILQENYKDAIDVIQNCIENYELDKNTEVDLLSYLSLAYIETGKYYEAEKVSKDLEGKIEYLDYDLKIANRIWLYIGYADIYNYLGEYEKVEENLKKSTELYEKNKDISFLGSDVSILTEYGDLFYNLGEYQKALDNHIKAYDILKLRDSKNGTTKILESISNDYYKLGEIEISNEILKEIKNIYDDEIKYANNQKVQNVYNRIILEDKNNKIDSMIQNKQILLTIILTLSVVLIVVYVNIRIIKCKKEKIKLMNDKLVEENVKDALTGIYNRKGLKDYLINIKNDNNINDNYAFFMIDIDCFKLYNDNYGHLKGDEILKCVAKGIQMACEEYNSFVARYGGEEFILILKYNDEEEIYNLVNRIYKIIELANIEHKYSSVSDTVTLSTGVCYGGVNEIDFVEIINQADIALYKSKENGRNRYTISKLKY